MFHWLFWTGVSFIIAGLISLGLAETGQGPPSFIEQIQGYSYAWIAFGVGMMVFGLVKKKKDRKI